MIKTVQNLLKINNIQSWLLITAENGDPFFNKIISPNTMGLSVALITANSVNVFVHSLDADNIVKTNYDRVHVYNSKVSIEELLGQMIQKLRIKEFALNYTTIGDANVDKLGHGTYLKFTKLIKKHISTATFISAEKLIYGIYDIKSEEELSKMSICARRANEILLTAFKKIKVGMSEKQVVEMTQELLDEKPKYFKEAGVIKETFSWEKNFCPIVLTGRSFLKGGHAVSSDQLIEKGNTVYFDFGVKLTFIDGTSWSSDIQRTGYVLRDEESIAPDEIQERFDIIKNSITEGIEKATPNMKGFELDKIVRDYVKIHANVDYDHATGHAIGESAHNPGAVIANRATGLAAMNIQENGVYTIEPRIPVENGVSIEEMVVIKSGGKSYTLCTRQTELIYING